MEKIAIIPTCRGGKRVPRKNIKNFLGRLIITYSLKNAIDILVNCGQFYCLTTKALLEEEKLYCKTTLPIELPESEVQDIDNEEDWKIAEMKFKMLNFANQI